MSDIVVTVPKGYFKEGRYQKDSFMFSGTRKPKRLKLRERIYIAYEGVIEEFYSFMGYLSEPDDDYFEFYLGDVRKLYRPFPCKGFQGFRYADRMGLSKERGNAPRIRYKKRRRKP